MKRKDERNYFAKSIEIYLLRQLQKGEENDQKLLLDFLKGFFSLKLALFQLLWSYVVR